MVFCRGVGVFQNHQPLHRPEMLDPELESFLTKVESSPQKPAGWWWIFGGKISGEFSAKRVKSWWISVRFQIQEIV
jgi:hypothetical protein